jgi:hypothetical protein
MKVKVSEATKNQLNLHDPTPDDLLAQIDRVQQAIKNILTLAYQALAKDAPQETRDSVRNSLEDFINQ